MHIKTLTTFMAMVCTTALLSACGGGDGGSTTPAPSYTVTAIADIGGGIAPGSVTVTQGATTAFTVTPDTGYAIANVTGCGGTLSGNTYTTGAISADCTVSASFELMSYTVSTTVGTGGGISPMNSIVLHGSTTAFTVTPDPGYGIASVTGCGGTLSGNTYTTGAISADCTVSATFGALYRVGGSVSGLNAGNTVTLQNNSGDDLILSANGGFTFSSPIVDGSFYAVTVLTQPVAPGIGCVVGRPSGFVGGNDVTNVDVGCGIYTDSGYAIGTDTTWSTVLGDVDGDSDLDMVVGNSGANRVYLNDGNGSYVDSGQALGSNFTHSIVLGDINGDGHLDMMAGNENADRVYLNDGAGGFNDSGQALGGGSTHAVTLGDVDNDGDLDMVAGSWAAADLIYLNDGNGIFTDSGQPLSKVGEDYTNAVSLGDVDGDGDLDLVVGIQAGYDRVYLNDGSANYTDSGQALGIPFDSTKSNMLGDLDGDGDLDLVTGNDNGFWVYLNDGAGNFSIGGQAIGVASIQSVALGDVDNDGDLDVVTAGNPQSSDAGRIYFNDGSASFVDSGQILSSVSIYNAVYDYSNTLGDVDGDGDLDVVMGGYLPKGIRMYINLSN